MTREELLPLIVRVCAIESAYKRWLDERVGELAAMRSCSTAEAYRVQTEELCRPLAPFAAAEINAVLDDIAATHRTFPAYSGLWRTIGGYAAEARQAKAERRRYDRDDEPRYVCHVCRDSGVVEIWQAAFVEAVRRENFAEGWFRRACAAWRGSSPRSAVALCCCDCDRARRLRQERERYRDGQRQRPPACGEWTYDPAKHLVCGANCEREDRLRAWCAEHDGSEQNTWNPDPGEYAERFS